MTPFIRFIFALIIVGAAINLTIVLAGNRLGEEKHRRLAESQRDALTRHYLNLIAAAAAAVEPAAHIAVESQEMVGDRVLNTRLVFCLYRLDEKGRAAPLPARRVVIPGDVLHIKGAAIAIKADFPNFEFLREKKLYLLTSLHAAQQTDESTHEQFYVPGEVPPAFRINNDESPSQLERQLWRQIGASLDAAKQPGAQKVAEALRKHPGAVMIPFLDDAERKIDQRTRPFVTLYKVVVNETGVNLTADNNSEVRDRMLRQVDSPLLPR